MFKVKRSCSFSLHLSLWKFLILQLAYVSDNIDSVSLKNLFVVTKCTRIFRAKGVVEIVNL